MSRGVRRLLNTTVEVWRPSTTDDGSGGQTTDVLLVDARVRARVSQPAPAGGDTGANRTDGNQSGADLITPIYFAPGQDVRRGDEIRAPGGRVFDVDAVVDPSEVAYVRADCTRRQPEGTP